MITRRVALTWAATGAIAWAFFAAIGFILYSLWGLT